ncbi:hypothetical protein VNO78_10130 [Psophocarpus tetragonolobus]|uniref:Uncharacterized protein n=1 Tax=Psophocarpus tetragonolobus TaxID=3891 RepID=A0AAN9SK55_PSOTE
MASSKALGRLSSGLLSLAPKNFTKSSLSLRLNPLSLSARRLSRFPVELGCLQSAMPLHSAVASARLVSSLSIHSLAWGLVPQEYEPLRKLLSDNVKVLDPWLTVDLGGMGRK